MMGGGVASANSARPVTRIVLIVLTMLLAACAPAASGATPNSVTLNDVAIELEATEVLSGRISLEIRNEGDLTHEVEVFSGATLGEIPPVKRSVADTSGLTLVDEVENILADSNASLVIDLEPGTYLVICNLPEHFQRGMWAFLTVDETNA